jgi:hypothetical protein
VNQFLFSEDEKMLLISTASIDILYDLKAKQERCRRCWQGGYGRRWINHPTDKSLLIWIDPTETYIFTWSGLEPLETPHPFPKALTSSGDPEHHEEDHNDAQSPQLQGPQEIVQWVALSTDRCYLTYNIAQDSVHSLSSSKSAPHLGKLSVAKLDHPELDEPLRELISNLPRNMRRVIGCPEDRIAFLDDEFRFCTWKIGSTAEERKWHFFVPRDWLSPMSLQLATVNCQGTFLCPKNGEVAVVRYGASWQL